MARGADAPAVLDRVLVDLEPETTVARRLDRVTCRVDGHQIEVETNVRSKLLLSLVTTTVSTEAVAGGAVAAVAGSMRFVHRGHLLRGALVARSVRGGGGATAVAARITASDEVQRHAAALDFTSFTVAAASGGPWRAAFELMGGTYVATRIPPSGRYNRIHPDQRAALVGLVTALAELP